MSRSRIGVTVTRARRVFRRILRVFGLPSKKRNRGNSLVRWKRSDGESPRHSRYAVSGLLCPNFCVHLSAHPFANPGIPRLGLPPLASPPPSPPPLPSLLLLLPASLVTGFHSWNQEASDKPFPIFSLFASLSLFLSLSVYLRLTSFPPPPLPCTEMPLFLLTVSQCSKPDCNFDELSPLVSLTGEFFGLVPPKDGKRRSIRRFLNFFASLIFAMKLARQIRSR